MSLNKKYNIIRRKKNNLQGRKTLLYLHLSYKTISHSALCTYFTLLKQIPAFFILISCLSLSILFTSCSNESLELETKAKESILSINIHSPLKETGALSMEANDYKIEFIDVFLFNNDKLKRLDSYQRFIAEDLPYLNIGAREGDKIAVVIANAPESLYNEINISCLESIMNLRMDFISDNDKYPIMSAMLPITTGITRIYEVALTPLLSKIRINSIKCDFTNKLYEGAVMKNVKFYMININQECEILKDSTYILSKILNQGAFDEDNFIKMNNPELIYKEFKEDIGEEICYPNINLYTYPNDTKEEDLGNPYTRLVIEGEINNKKYYYPINVNKDNFAINGKDSSMDGNLKNNIGCGIRKNTIYEFDITITRLGTNDPDKAVEPGMMEIHSNIKPWDEIDREIVELNLHKINFWKSNIMGHKPNEVLVSDLNVFIVNEYEQIDEHLFIEKEDFTQDENDVITKIKLLKNCNYDIYICANFGFSLKNIKTIEELKTYRFHLAYPDEYKAGIPMTGVVYDVNFNKNKVDIDLIRMMSKISFDIDRSKLDKNVQVLIRKLRIGSCPKSTLLFEESKARNPQDVFLIGYSLDYEETHILNFVEEGGRSESVAMYMLENMQGVDIEDTFDTHSYIEIFAEYFSEEYTTPPGEFIIYRFYIEDSNKSRNIIRNHHYHYTFRPVGKALKAESCWSIERPKKSSD